MNATALVLATDTKKREQITRHLSDSKLFGQVKSLASSASLLQHLSRSSVDMVCWAIDKSESQTDWIEKLLGMEQWHDLPLISFANVDDQQSLLAGFELGAKDSVSLSIDAGELRARLKNHLKHWQRLSALHQSKNQLEKMALTDSLTGIGNRATFDMSMKQVTARTQRAGVPFSLLMIDLDHFKWFNDTYGHQAGDNVLQLVAKAISSSARDADICCRYGGEEFAVILPDTEAKNALVLADRIHKQIARVSRKLSQHRLPITVSIGVSSAGQCGSTQPEDIIAEADRALYLAKENGRNRTETWPPGSFAPYSVKLVHPTSEPRLAFGA
ncbi:MAG TPA: diguanylate cyclase [Malonomonas sp.]